MALFIFVLVISPDPPSEKKNFESIFFVVYVGHFQSSQ